MEPVAGCGTCTRAKRMPVPSISASTTVAARQAWRATARRTARQLGRLRGGHRCFSTGAGASMRASVRSQVSAGWWLHGFCLFQYPRRPRACRACSLCARHSPQPSRCTDTSTPAPFDVMRPAASVSSRSSPGWCWITSQALKAAAPQLRHGERMRDLTVPSGDVQHVGNARMRLLLEIPASAPAPAPGQRSQRRAHLVLRAARPAPAGPARVPGRRAAGRHPSASPIRAQHGRRGVAGRCAGCARW